MKNKDGSVCLNVSKYFKSFRMRSLRVVVDIWHVCCIDSNVLRGEKTGTSVPKKASLSCVLIFFGRFPWQVGFFLGWGRGGSGEGLSRDSTERVTGQ